MTRKESFLEMNKDRANRGSHIIDAYRYMYEEWSNDAEVLTDILADLLHCTSQQTLSFDECLESARAHFEAERRGDD